VKYIRRINRNPDSRSTERNKGRHSSNGFKGNYRKCSEYGQKTVSTAKTKRKPITFRAQRLQGRGSIETRRDEHFAI
jgi:hypothetical protein